MTNLPPPPLTPESLAARWACSPAHVRALCRRGRLRHFRIGRGLYRITQFRPENRPQVVDIAARSLCEMGQFCPQNREE